MRLSPDQARNIVRVARELAGEGVRVRLFGSRVRDDLRGGDIDLLVESPRPVERPVWLAACIAARLQRSLGERRIDVLWLDPQTQREPVHEAALGVGIVLEA
ncbi:MAG: nucleotidyltransferase domain-containing protein [Pseudomonadota bacterium]